MGKGKRLDFTNLNKSNCDNLYKIPSEFNKKNEGFSFGISREHYNKVFMENNSPIDHLTPGPGKYDTSQKFGKDAPKFSIYSKLDINKLDKYKNKYTPGPGEYRPISIKSNGCYPLSNIKNTCAARFSKEKRFIEKSKDYFSICLNLIFFRN